ncbi:MAG: hypothetical protein LBQ93_02380 [Treponema sp.]|jgi:hypothetical protein|nr:hypothetical protein [Treponema sp.]
MKNFFKVFGVIAIAAVIVFGLVSCKDEEEGNTLVITNINDTQRYTEGAYGFMVGLFAIGTSDNDAKMGNATPIAWGEYYSEPSGSSNSWTVTVPLKAGNSNNRWTGSGNYKVGFECYSNGSTFTYYKNENISFSEGTTTVSASNFTKVP